MVLYAFYNQSQYDDWFSNSFCFHVFLLHYCTVFSICYVNQIWILLWCSMDNLNKCQCCSKKLQSHSTILKCLACKYSFHIDCISITRDDSIYVNRLSDPWICVICMQNRIPFNHLDDEEFYDCSIPSYCHKIGRSLFDLNHSDDAFYRIDSTDFEGSHDPFGDLNPDEQYFRFFPGIFNQSLYYDEDSFNTKINELGFSENSYGAIHFNCRSAPKNLCHVEDYLDCLDIFFLLFVLQKPGLMSLMLICMISKAINKKTIIGRKERVEEFLFL